MKLSHKLLSLLAPWIFSSTHATPSTEPPIPAYMIISVEELAPEKMTPYKQAVGPVAKKFGGIELLAFANPDQIQVMEGSWDHSGLLLIEEYVSMAQLKAFWYSNDYQEVKKLREHYAKVNFFIAVNGRSRPE